MHVFEDIFLVFLGFYVRDLYLVCFSHNRTPPLFLLKQHFSIRLYLCIHNLVCSSSVLSQGTFTVLNLGFSARACIIKWLRLKMLFTLPYKVLVSCSGLGLCISPFFMCFFLCVWAFTAHLDPLCRYCNTSL